MQILKDVWVPPAIPSTLPWQKSFDRHCVPETFIRQLVATSGCIITLLRCSTVGRERMGRQGRFDDTSPPPRPPCCREIQPSVVMWRPAGSHAAWVACCCFIVVAIRLRSVVCAIDSTGTCRHESDANRLRFRVNTTVVHFSKLLFHTFLYKHSLVKKFPDRCNKKEKKYGLQKTLLFIFQQPGFIHILHHTCGKMFMKFPESALQCFF